MNALTKFDLDQAEKLYSLDQPSLRNLSYALRHRELWPAGFEWNFSECSTCAMGLAYQLWERAFLKVGHRHNTYGMSRIFGMDPIHAIEIFLPSSRYIGAASVTPEMVAYQIDAYLKEISC